MSTVNPNYAEHPFVLCIDIGTSSFRTLLFDRLGRAVESVASRKAHILHIARDGRVEGDPDTILAGVFHCIDNTLQLAGSLTKDIAGVGLTTLVGNILGINSSNQAVTPMLTYADTRASQEALRLRMELDERVTHHRTGCHLHSSYLPAQFRWIGHYRPKWMEQVSLWASIADYLFLKVFGYSSTSYSIAAWTGLLNRHTLTWDDELFAHLPIKPEQMLPLCDFAHSISSLRGEFASRWPALAEIPWFPPIGDGASANIGSGCISPSQIALTLGTTGAMRFLTSKPIEHLPWGLWNYPIDRTRSIIGGAMTEGGNAQDWVLQRFHIAKSFQLEQHLAALPPDGHGLTILPFFAGERSPGWIGSARATIHGLSFNTQPLEILRAMLEAIAFRLSLIYELLKPLANRGAQIIASGGIIRSPIWLQIMSDVFNRPLTASNVTEASSRGVALLVLEALGEISDLTKVPDFQGQIYEPSTDHHQIYQQARARQQNLYKSLVRSGSLKD
ncbi:MAG: gluconokinase [Candidatus Heimdallarchaeota archaeon]